MLESLGSIASIVSGWISWLQYKKSRCFTIPNNDRDDAQTQNLEKERRCDIENKYLIDVLEIADQTEDVLHAMMQAAYDTYQEICYVFERYDLKRKDSSIEDGLGYSEVLSEVFGMAVCEISKNSYEEIKRTPSIAPSILFKIRENSRYEVFKSNDRENYKLDPSYRHVLPVRKRIALSSETSLMIEVESACRKYLVVYENNALKFKQLRERVSKIWKKNQLEGDSIHYAPAIYNCLRNIDFSLEVLESIDLKIVDMPSQCKNKSDFLYDSFVAACSCWIINKLPSPR